jgi:predicted RNA-binding Zn-ribbon protein involved in translation (DUF1610 family)
MNPYAYGPYYGSSYYNGYQPNNTNAAYNSTSRSVGYANSYSPSYSYQYANDQATAEVQSNTMSRREKKLAAKNKQLNAQMDKADNGRGTTEQATEAENGLAEKWIQKAKQPIFMACPAMMTPPPPRPAPMPAYMESYPYPNPLQSQMSIHPEATDLSPADLSKPLPPKKWEVTCPDCATKLTANDGAFAYRCPECGGVFQLRKIYRAKQNQSTETKESADA